MSEVIRYLNNAKEILRKSKIEDNSYADDKYVLSLLAVLLIWES